tara:strand:- start:1083 stop:1481 length:399 start_codon:yes stop_codon:yes gene_type:complete
MKKIFILLTTMFLLVGCVESVALLGGGLSNGKLVQSSLQSAASYGIKKRTGETPIRHALNYIKENNTIKEIESCSSFINKKDLEICLMVEKRIISKQARVKEKESSNNPSKELTSSLQSSINDRSKIKYLDQ